MSNNRISISDNNELITYESKLLYITYSKFEEDWNSLKHFHPFSEMFYVIGGKGRFTVESDTFDVKKNDLIIVNPNIYHHEDSDKDDPLEYVVLGASEVTFDLDGKESSFVYQNFDKIDDIQYYIGKLLSESEVKREGYQPVCQKLFELFLLLVIREMKISLSSNPIQHIIKREIRIICHYIDKNYADNITLDSLAEYMKMNKYYMAHEFKKNMNISPINYLIERRIKECKSLLETTSLSISEISETVGFSSQSYFSQMFKRNTGMTPKEYRDMDTKKEVKKNEIVPVYQKQYIFNS